MSTKNQNHGQRRRENKRRTRRRSPRRKPVVRHQVTARRKKDLHYRARHRRQNPTKAEKLLWRAVSKRRICGVPFKQQHVFGHKIADFYCAQAGLVVEIRPDGLKWANREDVQYFENCGLAVLRFTESEVCDQLEWVLRLIWGVCADRLAAKEPSGRSTGPRSADQEPDEERTSPDVAALESHELDAPSEHEVVDEREETSRPPRRVRRHKSAGPNGRSSWSPVALVLSLREATVRALLNLFPAPEDLGTDSRGVDGSSDHEA